ncbi:MAG TPA: FAD-dependent oxidoreductase [Gemmatimonadales bacterium]
MKRPHLLLAGGGHAHLFVLEGLAQGRFPADLTVTLIAPDRGHVYSGMVPGLVGSRYRPEELTIDVAALARAGGVAFRQETVQALDPGGRAVTLSGGERLTFDLLSLAIGAGTVGADLPGVRGTALFVKPIDRTLALVPAVERAAARAGRDPLSLVVAGGGAAGVELALNLRARLRLLGRAADRITLVEAQRRILHDGASATRRAAESALRTGRVEVVTGREIERLDGGRVVLAEGAVVEADLVVWATGPAAPALFAGSGLAADAAGYPLVDATLRSVSHPEVFVAGDAASLVDHPMLAKAGVYAVRQGPVLRDNLAAAAAGRPIRRRFRPRHPVLALLNIGDGRAICSYGPLAATGRWAMALKDRIDRRFIARFSATTAPPASPPDNAGSSAP